MSHYIRLKRLAVGHDSISYEFESSLRVFKRGHFSVRYGVHIPHPVESIHVIPFAAAMTPIAWATGAELLVPEIDLQFARGLENARPYFERWYGGRWPFRSDLRGARVRNAASAGRRGSSGLLFSGGIDSLAAFIARRNDRPRLFWVAGADVPLRESGFIAYRRSRTRELAEEQGLEACEISTDWLDALDEARLAALAPDWHACVERGLLLPALVAPVAYRAIERLYLGATRGAAQSPNAGDPGVVDALGWGGTRVRTEGAELSRPEKIERYLKPYPQFFAHLHACRAGFRAFHCGRCEACRRAICELLVSDLDPALCGFRIDDDFLPELRHLLSRRFFFFIRSERVQDLWRTIQEQADAARFEDRYGAHEFFAWMKDFKPLRKRHSRTSFECTGAWHWPALR